MGSLSEEEFRDPVRVFRKAFRKFSREDYDGFLSSLVYFSLGSSKGEENRKVIGPYLQLVKMLEAAHLLVEGERGRNEGSAGNKQASANRDLFP